MLLWAAFLSGCSKSPAPTAPSGEKPKDESALARTTLSAEEYDSLQIKAEPVSRESVQEQRELTGWVVLPPGREVTITAPIPGIVRELKGGSMPVPGSQVSPGREQLGHNSEAHGLFQLEPMVAPLDRIQLATLRRSIESDLAKARETVTVAESELKRVRELHEQRLRSLQDLEQAQARLSHAAADLAAATDKHKLFAAAGEDPGKAQLPPYPVEAPHGSTVLSVLVSPGQYVTAGTPLVTVGDLSELWLRVPVPEQELTRVDPKKRVTAVLRGRREKRFEAVSKALVPVVDPDRHTAELLYEVVGPHDGLFAKDQLVSVFVPLGGSREHTVVPYSAVVFDSNAGAWVYLEKSAPDAKHHVFERRRVELGGSVGTDVIVRPVLGKKDRVVISGAQELFSREFFRPPVAKGEKDEDLDDD
jgi:RND family efflux transporter MFP subunit